MSLMTHCIGCEEISSMIFINRWCWSRNLEVNKKKIRYISQFCFNNSEKVTQTAKILKKVHGTYTVAENNVQFWFRRFRPWIFDVKDAYRCFATFAEGWYTVKLDVWVPHDPTQKHLLDCITICKFLINRSKVDLVLKGMLTGNEKWINYENNI